MHFYSTQKRDSKLTAARYIITYWKNQALFLIERMKVTYI